MAINTIVDEDVVRHLIPQTEGGAGAGHRGISAEQDRAVMRIAAADDRGWRRRCWRRAIAAAMPQRKRVSSRIIADVRRRGDAALFRWTRRLDGARLTPKNVVGRSERAARRLASGSAANCGLRWSTPRAIFAAWPKQQLPRPWSIEVEPGVRVSQRVTPLDTIGCYIPGGRFSLVSTLLMTAIPAQVAGVRRIVVACPRPNAALLAAAEMLGLEEIAHIGGAQAIAALAYGTRSVPRVDKIFGPGNRYVTAAKRLVSADCAIDMLAGPDGSAGRGHARQCATTSPRTWWRRPSTIPTPWRCW